MPNIDTHRPAEGRRRAHPADALIAAGDAVSAFADARTATPTRQSPIPSALDYARDRLTRTDLVLGELTDTITRLIDHLEPVLTDGAPANDPDPGEETADTTADAGRRATVTRAIHDLGAHADAQGAYVITIGRRVEAIIDALEV